jgi:signal transduction histidine kinase
MPCRLLKLLLLFGLHAAVSLRLEPIGSTIAQERTVLTARPNASESSSTNDAQLPGGEKSSATNREPLGTLGSTPTPKTNKRIVLLYTHRVVSPVNSEWYQGIMAELKAAFPEQLDIDIEYLELLRNDDEEYEQRWIELLRAKYSRKPPDLVIPIYISAIEFVNQHREKIFPNTPVVFCSATQNLADIVRKTPGTTGTVFEIDFNGTRELIKRTLPDVKNLVVITGATREKLDLRSALGVGLLFSMYFGQVFELDVWDGVPLSEMQERIVKLKSDTAVLMLTYDFDRVGNQYVTVEVAEELSKISPVPVFGVFDSLVGRGVVGGSMASVYGQGRLAGRLAVEILRGKKPEELPVMGPEKPRLMFDERQVRKYGIEQARIPQSAEVSFKVPGLWETFGRYLLIGAAALLAQTAIIVSLLVNRRRRFAAEREARALAGKILTAQEEERSHLARELHDDLSQRLAAMAIEAGKLENQPGAGSVTVESLENLKHGIISICDDLHRLSRQMHPSILDDFGLEEALLADCTNLMRRSDIEVDCQVEDVPAEIPKPVELCLYRVAQESLWNAVKHSGASRISVRLTGKNRQLCLEVADNGCGIASAGLPPSKGLGLASIKERIRLVSGTVEIQSQPEKGTSIIASVPLQEFNS